MLDPDVHFLNHGSFGAVPKPVMDDCVEWLKYVEQQPVHFYQVQLGEHLEKARALLARYIKSPAKDIAFVPNATYAINMLARSLPLKQGDEVLTTDHEYGACDNIWTFLSQKQEFKYIKQAIPFPLTTSEDIVEQFWLGVTEKTKVIFISHITSSTAVIFPIAEICKRARKAGILTVIDGAHAIGQIPLDMEAIGADFYSSNAHKWLCSPKGSAFLYAHPKVQHLIEPLVVSWGWAEDRNFSYGSDFLDNMQWPGTWDVSAYLTVPAAIQFQAEHEWTAVRQQCHLLLQETLGRISELTGIVSPYPNEKFYRQMAIAPLPNLKDLAAFKTQLHDDYRVEAPCVQWHNHQFIRISIQGYNSAEDVNALLNALQELIPSHKAYKKSVNLVIGE